MLSQRHTPGVTHTMKGVSDVYVTFMSWSRKEDSAHIRQGVQQFCFTCTQLFQRTTYLYVPYEYCQTASKQKAAQGSVSVAFSFVKLTYDSTGVFQTFRADTLRDEGRCNEYMKRDKVKVMVRVKTELYPRHEGFWESGSTDLILNLGTTRKRVSVLRPDHFTPQIKSLWHPFNRKLNVSQSLSWIFKCKICWSFRKQNSDRLGLANIRNDN